MPQKYKDMLKEKQENPETVRFGVKWEKDEDETLLEKVRNGVSLDEIAKVLKRTEGSLRTRLITGAINRMESLNETLEDVSTDINIPTDEILDYQRRKKIRDEKRLQKIFKNKQQRVSQKSQGQTQSVQKTQSSQVSISDVYTLLLEVKSELTKLTG
jgi:hypothetical protein